MNTNIDPINTVYLALALLIGIASVVVVSIYLKDGRDKAIQSVYADDSKNTVHAEITGLRKEVKMSIWLIFCTNIGICLLIFKGLH